MFEPSQSPSGPELSFCPFCREGFDDVNECPEHELALVPYEDLPRLAREPLNEVTVFIDPRLGRGFPLLGASLVLLGFLAPYARNGDLSASALEVAIDGAHNLWLIPAAAVAVLSILSARRRRADLRAARVAVFALALGGALPLIYTTRRIALVAGAAGAEVHWRWGLVVIVLGLLFLAVGGARLGGRASDWVQAAPGSVGRKM